MTRLGLTTTEADDRLRSHGPNQLIREKPPTATRLLLRQFASPVVGLLIAACALSAVIGDVVDALAIGAIVLMNALVGFIQEHHAERALQSLRSMTAPRARVLRDGGPLLIPSTRVVPGDVLLLEAGDIVAADARIIEAHALTANEAALTGESLPTEKSTQPSAANAAIPERRDHVFMGTHITSGIGRAEIVGTGMRTELGRVAHLLTTAQSGPTPLQQRLAHTSQVLMAACLVIVSIVGIFGLWRGQPLLEVVLAAVSLAVAAVPEGLPAIVTVALAIGVRRLTHRHVLVRHLAAVESIGGATVICTDKTGTLTTGEMAVRELWGVDERRLIESAALACDLPASSESGPGLVDPTEIAITRAASNHGIDLARLAAERLRRFMNPFDSDRRRMSVGRSDGTLYVKGAFESVRPLCMVVPPDVDTAHDRMTSNGLRVLAIAIGHGTDESNLELLGLVGIADPPREGAISALADARRAGVRTVMITGDHPVTARTIARDLGLIAEADDPSELVHARASPEDKLRIVREWKQRGAVVAMTGDGVNDAPALREAHVGICMGRTGTEVSREAADMILTDDRFETIIEAVREGRRIFDRIRTALVYLLTGNAAELGVMLFASVAGLPIPFVPVHLLWINLVTDGLPAIALVTGPVQNDVLARPPRPLEEPILGRTEWRQILLLGVIEAGVTLAMFASTLSAHGLDAARTLAFTTLVFSEIFRALAVGSMHHRLLWIVAAATLLIQLGLTSTPSLRTIFHLAPVTRGDLGRCILVALIPAISRRISLRLRGRSVGG